MEECGERRERAAPCAGPLPPWTDCARGTLRIANGVVDTVFRDLVEQRSGVHDGRFRVAGRGVR